MKKFLRGRLDLAKYLHSDVPSANYADVVLIITAILSACASLRWPGEGNDKKRFIELLVKHSCPDLHASWVSIPALIDSKILLERDTPYGKPGDSDRIFTGREIDMSIEDAQRKYPKIKSKQLKEHCYASIIYKWLRCGYAHEYCPDENITQSPPSRRDAKVSYIGRGMDDRGEVKMRMVGFHLDYLFSVADDHIAKLPSTKSEQPSKWWIDEQ